MTVHSSAPERAHQPTSWQWMALGLAALAILILTAFGGFAIYTWGWQKQNVVVEREPVSTEPGQTGPTVTGAGGESDSPGSRGERAARTDLGDSVTAQAVQGEHQRAFAAERMRRYGIPVPAGVDPLTYYKLVGSKLAAAAFHKRQREFAIAQMRRYGITVPAGADPVTYYQTVGSKLVASGIPLKHPGRLVVSGWWLKRLLVPPLRPGGKVTGFDADVVNRIAARYAVPLVQWVDALRAPLAAQEGADFAVNNLVNGNGSRYRYSTPILANNLGLLVRTGSKAAAARSLSTVAKLKIGVPNAATAASVEQTVRPRAALLFSSYDSAVSALKNGEVDALFIFLPEGSSYDAKGLEFTAQVPTGLQYAFQVAVDSPILPALNRALGEMRASGTIDRLVKKWFPKTYDLPVLTR